MKKVLLVLVLTLMLVFLLVVKTLSQLDLITTILSSPGPRRSQKCGAWAMSSVRLISKVCSITIWNTKH
jgi:hypothetical protein